jgi:Flp pilus assembly protein protease CpaA
MLVYFPVGLVVLLLQLLIIFSLLVIATYTDLKKGIIPVSVTLPLCVIGIISSVFPETYINILIAVAFLVVAIPLYSKKLLGGGDVKLITGLLLFNPLVFIRPDFYIFFGLFTCITGLTLYVVLKYVVRNKKLIENKTLRFAPALLVGWTLTAIMLLWGLL